MTTMTTNEKIEQLETEVRALRSALKASTSLRGELKPIVEEYLEGSALIRFGKWLLAGAIAFGMVIWVGGAFYGISQMRTLHDEAKEGAKTLKEEIDKRTAEIAKNTAEVRESAAGAISDINTQKALVRQRLSVDSLPDVSSVRALIARLNSELVAVESARGKLNINALATLSGYSVWILFAAAAVSSALSAIAFKRS